jgi:hypothetical protein
MFSLETYNSVLYVVSYLYVHKLAFTMKHDVMTIIPCNLKGQLLYTLSVRLKKLISLLIFMAIGLWRMPKVDYISFFRPIVSKLITNTVW